jgi:hypothetical protein
VWIELNLLMLSRSTALAIVLASVLAAVLPAQEIHGYIGGRITDPSGVAVAGAPVTVLNADTAAATHVVTNGSGYYEANLLLPGNYEVSAKAEGFKQALRKGISLAVGARVEIDLRLELGAVSETVSVVADVPLLDSDSGSTGRVMDSHILNDVPVLNNVSLLLAELTPGVQSAGVNSWVSYHSGGGGLVYSINGGVGGNDFAVDGVPNNAGRSAAFIPHTEAISEFKMETSGFDASMGHSTGITISMMTKSGANNYHGSLTETYWNQQWQAAPFFVRQLYYTQIANAKAKGDLALASKLASVPELPDGFEHNYAATIGGPVNIPKLIHGRNKLFFFFAYNGFKDSRSEEPNTMNHTVPSAEVKKGDFSQLLQIGPQYTIYDPLTVAANPARPGQVVRTAFPGNILPQSRINNPLFKLYSSFYPDPNVMLAANQDPTNNYLASQMKWNMMYNGLTNRVDYNMSEKDRFFVRWSWFHYHEQRSDWTYATTPGIDINDQIRGDLGANVDWTHTFSPSTVIDFNFGTSDRMNWANPVVDLSYKPSDVGLPAYMDARAGARTILPQVNISGYNNMGVGYPALDKNRLMTAKSDIFHLHGNHTIRAGVDVRGQYRNNFGGGTTSGSISFDNYYTRKDGDGLTASASNGLSWAAFMLGMPTSMSMGVIDSSSTFNLYSGYYVQDTWRISPRLSMSAGLRIEYETGPTERFNRAIAAFDPKLTLPITTIAQNAYAAAPVPELAASAFSVMGGSYYPGTNGRDRKLWQNELLYLPRFSFAYSLTHTMVIRGGYGMFYDSNNVQNYSADLSGYNRTTSTTFSTDWGQNFVSGNPKQGITPLVDPFPVRADGTRFDDPTGNLLGSMTKAGSGWTFTDPNLKHPRQQRGGLSVQKQIGKNDLLDVAYSGAHSDHLGISMPLQPLPSQYWAHGNTRDNAVATAMNLAVTNPFNINNYTNLKTTDPLIYNAMNGNSFFTSKTIGKNRLLRAYPQMNGLNETTSIGETKSHALITSFTHRSSKGWMMQGSFTTMYAKTRDYFYDEYNPTPSWRSTNNTRPQRVTVIGSYDFPFGRGKSLLRNGWASKVAGGWKLSGTYVYQPGPLLSWGNIFFYGNLQDIASDNSTLAQWFNTANFNRVSGNAPNSFQARVFPTVIDGVRADKTSQINANLQREFALKERYKLLARLDVLNVMNRSQFDVPSTDPLNTNFGKVTAQTTAQNRFLQVQVRFRF